jgi:hypothetical protein
MAAGAAGMGGAEAAEEKAVATSVDYVNYFTKLSTLEKTRLKTNQSW